VLACDDLMMASRVREAVRETPWCLLVVSSDHGLREAINAAPPVVLVSLHGRRFDPFAIVGYAAAKHVTCIAFAGHVETELHQRARDAGATHVVANSSIALHLRELMVKCTGLRLETEP